MLIASPNFFYKICIFSLGNCHLPSLHPAQSLKKTIKLWIHLW